MITHIDKTDPSIGLISLLYTTENDTDSYKLERLDAALSSLTDRQESAIRLKYLHGATLAEIAKVDSDVIHARYGQRQPPKSKTRMTQIIREGHRVLQRDLLSLYKDVEYISSTKTKLD